MSEPEAALRPDLLALTEETLAALANRGIVRRASREIDEGKEPILSVGDDGTVIGRFPDGVLATLPPSTPLDAARCTCASSGICRHRIATVLAFQRRSGPSQAGLSGEMWSPAVFTDQELDDLLGPRTMAAARKALQTGFRALIRRPTAADPVPKVELASCTVRFLVPRALAYAHTDAARGARDEAVALAVWAFRLADELFPAGAEVELDVGGPSRTVTIGGALSGVEAGVGLVADLLMEGATHTGTSFDGVIEEVRRDLDRGNLRWLVDLIDGIGDQLAAYRSRSARYDAEQFAALLAEVVARHRSVIGRGASLRSQVLGTEEAAETPLRRLRLTGIGGRVKGTSDSRTVQVFLAHAEAGQVLVLQRQLDAADGDELTGEQLGLRRLGSSTLAALAAGNVVTESAVRSARRLVRIASNRVARTTVAVSAGDWSELPEGILVHDLGALSSSLARLPPRLVRPRVEAELVRVVSIGDVLNVAYEPGAQRLRARVQGSGGGNALVSLEHQAMTGGALDALASALRGDFGAPRFISGTVHRFRGDVVIEPLAVAAGSSVVLPAFAPDGRGPLGSRPEEESDSLVAALDSALDTSAEVAHRGLRHLSPHFGSQCRARVDALRKVGLTRAADALARLISLTSNEGPTAVDAWADAHIRLICTAECL